MAMWNLQKLKHIRKFLNQKKCHTLVCGLVLTHLRLCQCNFGRSSHIEIANMQSVQNITAKFVMGADNYSSPIECRIKLHWLPVQVQIKYKVLLLVYKCIQKKLHQSTFRILLVSIVMTKWVYIQVRMILNCIFPK